MCESRTDPESVGVHGKSLSYVSVQLLSLGGRSDVQIHQVAVGLRFRSGAEFRAGPAAGIDLHRVQAMMEEMGATLSPGAQNLMEMVQFQQKVSLRAGHACLTITQVSDHTSSPNWVSDLMTGKCKAGDKYT